MSGEQDILVAILNRLDALDLACDEDLVALGALPTDVAALAALSPSRRVASRALLKTVEQMEDQLARLFRLLPKLMLADHASWFAQDYANFAERMGILADGLGWAEMVKLRNRLAHDYPLQAEAQVTALGEAFDAVRILRRAISAARGAVVAKGLLP